MHEKPVEEIYSYILISGSKFFQYFDALLDGKKSFLRRAYCNGDDYFVKQKRGTLDNVDVSEGDGIECPGVDDSSVFHAGK